jgi:hypothetical protein
MELVINSGYGIFKLSYKAVKRYAELKDTKIEIDTGMPIIYLGDGEFFEYESNMEGIDSESYPQYLYYHIELEYPIKWTEEEILRNDPALIKVVKELGKEANTNEVLLSIVEIPDGADWDIEGGCYGESIKIIY